MLTEAGTLQNVVYQTHHRSDYFRWCVIRSRKFPKSIVVHLEEVFVKIEPGIGFTSADLLPVNGIQHARQSSKRSLERRLILSILGQQLKSCADKGACFSK